MKSLITFATFPSEPFLNWLSLYSTRRLGCQRYLARLFGLDPPTPVSHRPDQLADFLASALIAQIDLLVEESGGMRHQHLRVGYDDRPGATEHPAQGRLRVRRK
jgi:hypothetical protein